MPWIDNARILAIAAVIMIHAVPPVTAMHAVGSESWWIAALYDASTRWCVPVLVMLSGRLLLDPAKAATEAHAVFYRKRMARILLPTLFWSVFYLIWTVLKNHWHGEQTNISALLFSWLRGKPYYHLWFIYMLAGLYVVTPWLRRYWLPLPLAAKKIWLLALFSITAGFALYCALVPAERPDWFLWWSVMHLPYFLAGSLPLSPPSLPAVFRVGGMLACTVAIATGIHATAGDNPDHTGFYFDGPLSLTVIPFALLAWQTLAQTSRPWLGQHTAAIARLTFGVYLMHPAMLEVLAYIGLRTTAFSPVAAIPSVTVIVFCATLVAAWMVSRLPLFRSLI